MPAFSLKRRPVQVLEAEWLRDGTSRWFLVAGQPRVNVLAWSRASLPPIQLGAGSCEIDNLYRRHVGLIRPVHMNGVEILTTIAQLGIAVAGFSGIAIVFNRQPGGLCGFEAFRVSLLFANSFAAVFLSLIPFGFFYFGWSEELIWRTASGVCFAFEVAFMATHVPWVFQFLHVHRELFNFKLLTFVAFGHLINAVAQLLNTLGMTEARLSIFIFGLLWLLFHGAFQFGRILFVQPGGGGGLARGRNSK